MALPKESAAYSRQATDPQPTPVTEPTPQNNLDSPAVSPSATPETAHIVDNINLNQYHSVSRPLQSGIAAAWPSEEEEEEEEADDSEIDQTVTLHIPAINKTRDTSSDIEVDTIPENVHALFKQEATHSTLDNEGLVVNFPADEDIDFEVLEPPQEPFLVDALSQEQHRLLNNSNEDEVTRTPSSQRDRLAGLKFSRTGLIFSITMLMVLWWFTYGSGSFYLMQLLHRITSIAG